MSKPTVDDLFDPSYDVDERRLIRFEGCSELESQLWQDLFDAIKPYYVDFVEVTEEVEDTYTVSYAGDFDAVVVALTTLNMEMNDEESANELSEVANMLAHRFAEAAIELGVVEE